MVSQVAQTRLSRRSCLGVCAVMWLPTWVTTCESARAQGAAAAPAELVSTLPGARLHGQGRMRWFGLTVYDARLWVRAGFVPANWADASFALELQYARALRGTALAERSLDEMRRVGSFSEEQSARWLAAMRSAFVDVAAHDRLTGIHQPGQGVDFFHNARPTAAVADPLFARLFFGIWLAPQTSQPSLRAALLREAAR